MITSNDFSFLMVTKATDLKRLNGVYESIRELYPTNEIVIIYDGISNINLNVLDKNLLEVYSSERVYVSSGYNLALKASTKRCFVFVHDDTFLAKNFLENIIPHISEKQFCNFTSVEPPVFNNPDVISKPIKDFGRSMETFNLKAFHQFSEEHIQKISTPVIESPFGGFFMAGFKSSIDIVGGFDEYFKPYFHEDADLMMRLHGANFNFVQVLTSLVYHMGSMTARGTSESDESMRTTSQLFIKKWKTTWEFARHYTLANGIPYKKIPVEIQSSNCHPQLETFFSFINELHSDMIISVDGNKLTQQDIEYLQSLPYVLQSIDDDGQYELGNLIVNYKKGRYNV